MRSVSVVCKEKICGFPKPFVRRIVAASVERSGVVSSGVSVSVGVSAISREGIRKLNKTYRQKDAPTDVLSFPEHSDIRSALRKDGESVSIGDIVLCCEVLSDQAKQDGVSEKREFAYLLSHGVLHLLGYDHDPKMFSIQDEVCDFMDAEREK